ncbi:MAG: hypothetical protein ACJ8FS_16385 [Sphingomicrobium sp.]
MPDTIEPATTFDVTIDFGRHQAKLTFDKDEMRSAKRMSGRIAGEIEPHIQAMLDAEDRQRKIEQPPDGATRA